MCSKPSYSGAQGGDYGVVGETQGWLGRWGKGKGETGTDQHGTQGSTALPISCHHRGNTIPVAAVESRLLPGTDSPDSLLTVSTAVRGKGAVLLAFPNSKATLWEGLLSQSHYHKAEFRASHLLS